MWIFVISLYSVGRQSGWLLAFPPHLAKILAQKQEEVKSSVLQKFSVGSVPYEWYCDMTFMLSEYP